MPHTWHGRRRLSFTVLCARWFLVCKRGVIERGAMGWGTHLFGLFPIPQRRRLSFSVLCAQRFVVCKRSVGEGGRGDGVVSTHRWGCFRVSDSPALITCTETWAPSLICCPGCTVVPGMPAACQRTGKRRLSQGNTHQLDNYEIK